MKKLIVFFLILILLGSLAFFLPKKLIIKNVTCESQFGPCNEALKQSLQSFGGASITQARRQIKDFLEQSAQVSEFSLQLAFPDTLEVKVVERKALVALTIAGLESFVVIDDDGTVINVVEKTALPIVVVKEMLENTIGDEINVEYLFAASIMSELFRSYQVRVGEVTGMGLEAEVSGAKVIFPLSGDLDLLFGELTLIFSSKSPTFIDLRFQNPVIK